MVLRGKQNLLRQLVTNREGVAAIEFSLIVPLLFAMYFLTLEVALAIDTSKKVSRAGSMIADLVAQQGKMSKSELLAILDIGGSLIQPYNRSEPTITVTAVEIITEATEAQPSKVRVVWSRELKGETCKAGASAGSATTVPEKLNTPGSFFIRVESELVYRPIIAWTADQKATLGIAVAFDKLDMKDTYHLRPRQSQTIPCSDCYK